MKNLVSRLFSQGESRFVFCCILVVIILTGLPYLYGFLMAPSGSTYTGIHSLAPGDINVYYSYLEQVKQGNILFQDLFTAEPQAKTLFNPFWLIAGLFASLFHLSGALALQLIRLLLVPIFILALYKFLKYIIADIKIRKLALIFLLFSSGLGGVLVPALTPYKYIADNGAYYNWPMDLWVPESNTFLTLYHLPHILFSSILIVVIFLLFMRAVLENKKFFAFLAGGCSLILMLFHPFHLFTIWLVPLVWLVVLILVSKDINWRRLKIYLIYVISSLPAVIYQLVFQLTDKFAQARLAQNILITPKPWLVLISYGFLLVFALIGALLVLKRIDQKQLFLVIWATVQLALIYAPIFFQRRLSQCLHIPLAILAASGILALWRLVSKYLGNYFEHRLIRVFIFLVVFFPLFAGSTIYVLVNDVSLYTESNIPFFYLNKDITNSFAWIKDNTSEQDVFLSEVRFANFIPGWTGRKIYAGHGVETINYLEKLENVKEFFGDQEWDRHKFLNQQGINYLFLSGWEDEKMLWPIEKEPYLRLVYQSGAVKIYQVVN